MFLNHTATRSGLTALTVFFLAASQSQAAPSVKVPTKAPSAVAGHATSATHATSAANHTSLSGASAGHTTAAAGHTTTGASAGHTTSSVGHTNTAAGHSFKSANGNEAHFGSHGEVRSAHVNGMTINHGPGGTREVVRERGGARVVSREGGRGYVAHGYMVGHDRFEHRSYYYHGARYERYYRSYYYHGVAMGVYLPGYYYGPAFYGWAYAPWAAPIYYNWAFTASPWYAYYGGYFTPYAVYASPSLWLTDYLVATSLQQAYQAQVAAAQAANAAAGAPAPLSPEVKQAIADEIRRQIALENVERQGVSQNASPDAASSGIARMLSDNGPHVFVVGSALMLNSNVGECGVTEGDVLQLAGAPQGNDTNANLVVLASKGADCSKGATVSVAVNDLQEMQNHMRETIDQGMGELKSRQGQAGLPAIPAVALAAPVKPQFATLAPPPDPNAAAEITQQAQDAAMAEQDLVSQSLGAPAGGGHSAPVAR